MYNNSLKKLLLQATSFTICFFQKSHTIFFGFKHIPAWIWDTIFFRFKPKIWPKNKIFFKKSYKILFKVRQLDYSKFLPISADFCQSFTRTRAFEIHSFCSNSAELLTNGNFVLIRPEKWPEKFVNKVE